MSLRNKCQQLFNAMHKSIVSSLQHAEHQLSAVGLVGFVGFPLFYIVWSTWYPQNYENLTLRMLGACLCFGLMIKDYWPLHWRRYLPLYWYVTILYSLPFFFSFFLLKSHCSLVSVMSMLMATFLLILLVDWVGLAVLSTVGFLLAWGLYAITEHTLSIPVLDMQYIFVYAFTIVAGSVFNYKTALLQQEKLEGMSSASGSVAHELRTPLLGIKSGASGLRRYLPILFDAYRQASAHQLPVGKIRASHFHALEPILDRIEAETHYANTIIDMLLMNVGKQTLYSTPLEPLSMCDCIDEALARYPFETQHERELVQWSRDTDFQFMGSKLLMVHVLFNLIKNALYFIAKAHKGEITLTLSRDAGYHTLQVTDTGQGIAPDVLPKLFNRFFTTTHVGTGIGLSFCKMVVESFSGKISCHSRAGEYTTFVIMLPVIAQGSTAIATT